MIIISNKSKEELVKLETKSIGMSWSSASRVSMSLDFGTHMAYSDYNQVIEENVFHNLRPAFKEDDMLDDLNMLPELVYVYKLDETDFNFTYVPLSELLMSDNDDEFSMGCFLAARMLYLNDEQNYSLYNEIDLGDEDIIYNLDKESLRRIILKRDKVGRASLIGEILIGESKELLYKNTLRLDQTGELSYAYIQQAYSLIEEVENKILEKDNEGLLTIDLLNFIDCSPMYLAEKIVSINNPFRIIDFINRYEEYICNVKDTKADTDFVKEEKVVVEYLNNALKNLDYANIDMVKLVEKSKYYEVSLKYSLFKIIDSIVSKGNLTLIENFLDLIKKQFNDDFINEFESVLDRGYIENIKHYNLGSDIVYTVILASGKILVSKKTVQEFLKFSEKLILNSDKSIELKELI